MSSASPLSEEYTTAKSDPEIHDFETDDGVIGSITNYGNIGTYGHFGGLVSIGNFAG